MYKFISCFRTHDVVGVKSCEHEPSLASTYARAFARLPKKRGQAAFICTTSNCHMDCRSNAIILAQDEIGIQDSNEEFVPSMALDGLYGEYEMSRKTHRYLESDVYLAGELTNLDGLFAVSCLAPSREKEVGGSIVNLGQGLASKKGKIFQRTTSCPQVNVKKCYQCRRCVRQCSVNAIAISEGYAVLEERVVFINIVMRDDGNGRSFAGGMVSQDPVALDCATVDFCEKDHLLPDEQVRRIRSQIEAAESAGIGTGEYEMETVPINNPIEKENDSMNEEYYGRMNDPSGAAVVTGPCGDTMEFYLVIENEIITQVKYYTDGCQHTRLCGHAVACHAQGAPITVALGISARHLLQELPNLPKEHRHCAILAVSTFYRAVG